MKSLFYYLLQASVASGILYSYYHFALRNKKFHRYNRFYLLSATVVSILIPFLNIPVYFTRNETDSSFVLQTLTIISSTHLGEPITQTIITPGKNNSFTPENILYGLYILVLVIALVRILFSLQRIRQLVKNNTVERLDNIRFVNTDEPGTPFSFFHWLFWNRKIELRSQKGEQIFRHELFHIEQKHSWDIIYMELLTIIFWINPFFHLIRKEIKAIHEFLADHFAIDENNKWEYAELLLMQALNTQQHLVNPFFNNQIKRRITMITSSQKPRHQYLGKLMVLPVAVIVIALFAFAYKTKSIEPDNLGKRITKGFNNKSINADTSHPGLFSGTMKIVTIDSINSKESSKIVINGKKLNIKELKIEGLEGAKIEAAEIHTSPNFMGTDSAGKPLIIIDGIKQLKNSNLGNIDPATIESISVYKNDTAIAKYGNEGKNGVIEIFTKKKPIKSNGNALVELQSVDTTTPDKSDNKIFERVEIEPSFPGGETKWKQYLAINADFKIPFKNGAPKGDYIVVVQFIVDKEGGLHDIKALTHHGYGMEEEAIRLVSKGPKWIPAVQNGHVVNAHEKQPVTFVIEEKNHSTSYREYPIPANGDYNDPDLGKKWHEMISEIKAIGWKEGKAAYEYRGRTYVFGQIKNPDPTVAAFTEQNGTGHVFLLNGKLIKSVIDLNALITRNDVKKFGFISQEEMLKRFNRNDATVFIETSNEPITKN